MTWLLADRVAALAATRPDDLAVVDGRRRMTWARLSGRADAIVRSMHSRGVRAGDRVALEMPASGRRHRRGRRAAPDGRHGCARCPAGLTTRERETALALLDPAIVVDGGVLRPVSCTRRRRGDGTRGTGHRRADLGHDRSAEGRRAVAPGDGRERRCLARGPAARDRLGAAAGDRPRGRPGRPVARDPRRCPDPGPPSRRRAAPAPLRSGRVRRPATCRSSRPSSSACSTRPVMRHRQPTLRAVLLGGGPVPPALVERAVRAGWPVVPTYGLSEMGSGVTALPSAEAAHAPGTAGRPSRDDRAHRRPGAGRRGRDRRCRAVAELGVPRRAAGTGRRARADRRSRQARRGRPARRRRPPDGPDRARRRERRSRRRSRPCSSGTRRWRRRPSWGVRTTPGGTCRWPRSCSGRARPTPATSAGRPCPREPRRVQGPGRLDAARRPAADVVRQAAAGRRPRARRGRPHRASSRDPAATPIGWRVDGSRARATCSCSTGR